MIIQKAEQLEKQYFNFVELLKNNFPLEKMSLLFVADIMGYGSNLDEKVLNFSELHESFRIQKEQSVGLELQFEITPISRRISHEENVAIYVDEIRIMMFLEGVWHENVLRLSIIFEFIEERWICTHFHGSKAINVEGDAWATDLWKKKNEELQRMVDERTIQLQNSVLELKSTQTQLIQSEKLASLGELTAGIAHEIQNPLNFVNNFSEVNKELLAELKDELKKGNLDEVNAIADDVISNEGKINHHGKRADAIVKGMLQHSRAGSGHKEPTDINALCDEYLRLAYHGLKAKDQSFNASFHFEPDETLPKVDVVPQDIGRVLLNLINNAFYAVDERLALSEVEVSRIAVVEKKTLQQAQAESYEPTVIVSTRKMGSAIQITVKDNGNGIPQKVMDKIFQPFFTTKPTGQGTGLGLSLSYDIIKAHGGKLKVESNEGEGCIFIIQIPVV